MGKPRSASAPPGAVAGPGTVPFDFNGDGKPDILLQNQTTGAVYYWLLNGTSIASAGYVWQGNIAAWNVMDAR